jgi:anti-sigma regulatory factor (Ser/Thr protein kinase)
MMSLYSQSFQIASMDFLHAGEASIRVKNILQGIGAEPGIIRRVAIAAYEAEINVVVHGGGGTMNLELDEQTVKITVEDQGPGIPDIELAMREGYSTAPPEVREMGFGAGMGLPNIKRNVDELDIVSQVGVGTRVVMILNAVWTREDQ